MKANNQRENTRLSEMFTKLAMVVPASIALCLCAVNLANAQASFTSTVDEPTGRPWIGFGYNQDPLDADAVGANVTPWDTDHWNLLTQRMAAIKPSVVRVMLNQEYFNPSHVAGTYTWNSPQMQAVYQVFDWYKANNVAILTGPWTLTLLNFGDVGNFGTDSSGTNNLQWVAGFQSSEYTQICADLMHQLRVVKGYTNIEYFTPMNEPRGVANVTYTVYKNCIDNLSASFTAQGLPTTVITGPDSWGEFIYEAPRLSSQSLFSYENHLYSNAGMVVSGSLERQLRGMYGAAIYQFDNTKPCILGESGASMGVDIWYVDNPIPVDAPTTYTCGLNSFDYGLQVLRSGYSASMIWSLTNYSWKQSGMWSWSNSNPLWGGTTLRPFYYTWSLLCRYFPRGMTMYRMTQPTGDSTRIAAGQQLNSDGSSHWTFGIVNQSATAQNITVRIPGWAGGSFKAFTYSSSSAGDGSSLVLPSTTISTSSLQYSGVLVSVPAQSCVLLTTLDEQPIQPAPGLEDPLGEAMLTLSESANIASSAVEGATTVCLTDSNDGAITYQYPNPAGIAVDVIGADGIVNERIRVYTSPDNLAWTQLPTINSAPVYSGGGYWAASTFSNSSVVPLGTQYIKVVLVNDGIGWKTQVDHMSIQPGQNTFFDPLHDLSRCYSSAGVGLDSSQPWLTAGDSSRGYNSGSGMATLVYKVHNFSDFKTRVYGYNGSGMLAYYASPDGITWSPVATANSIPNRTIGAWDAFYDVPTSSIPGGMNFLKIEYPATSAWATQIGDVTISTDRQPTVFRDALFDSEKAFSTENLIYLNNGYQSVLGSNNLYSPANDTDDGVMVYRYPGLATFDVTVFGADLNADNKLLVFGSPDNLTWTQIPTRNSAPQNTDGYWVDSHYTPSGTIATNTNFLKIVLVNNGLGWKTIANHVAIYPSALNVTSATSAAASNGGAFNYQITGDGSPTSYTAYGLPPGLVLDPNTGLITGTSTATGTYSVTIGATSALGMGTHTLSITVLPQPPVITSAATATGTKAAAFSYQIAASNVPTSYSASGLPAGLSVNPGTGLISGTPTVSGTFNATISADNAGGTGKAALTITVISTDPPAPWLTGNIGTTGLVGSVTYSGGAYTVAGAGLIGSTQDAERFVYQPLIGDGSIVARISSLGATGTTAARVGIQIRDTLAANSRVATLAVEGSGAFKWMRRTTTGGSTSSTNSSSGVAPNIWIRLTRAGNVITASKSTNGTSWTSIGSATITMASNCSIGLVVGSGSTTSLNTSVFANVAVVP